VRSTAIEPLLQLAARWRSVTRASRWRAALAVIVLGTAAAFLAARAGTAPSRAFAGALIAATLVFALVWREVEHRRLRDPHRILRGPVGRVDPPTAARALRALSLLDGIDGEAASPRPYGTSAELARIHVARAFAGIPAESVGRRAAAFAKRVGAAALVLGGAAVALAYVQGWSMVEGADVLLAQHGTARFPMTWLEGVDVSMRPPEYLRESPISDMPRRSYAIAYGSAVTLRGSPVRPGRRLFLTDGAQEIPFVDDGAGAVVARYTLAQSVVLRVVARFGDVVIPEAETLRLTSIADEAPIVHLEGAPREVPLLDAGADIPIRYEAEDDHGLREVHLVLRSGTREERRVLSRLDGETRSDKGGSVLRLRDPFLAKSHAPVAVTVEAKDNDPLLGPKWGASEAITLIPPDVGDPEAKVLEALRRVRDAIVDSLAVRLANEAKGEGSGKPSAAESKAMAAASASRAAADETILEDALGTTLAGVRVPSRVRALLTAQVQSVRKAVDAEIHAPSQAARVASVRATERFALVVDAAIRGLGERDTRASARDLADVADDLVLGLGQMRNEGAALGQSAHPRGEARASAATGVLAAGGKVMLRLGVLGRDIGEIVDADLARVARARSANDLVHAELAARDLATRLRTPDPSFGQRGGTRRAGGESGGAHGTPSEGDEGASPDEVEEAFNEAAQDLDRLAQDHAGEIGKMEEAMAGATSDDERKEMRDEAKAHADKIREAARELPPVGMGSDSWTSKGSAARDLAQQMAQSLEDGKPESAVQSGRSALGALDEAKRMFQKGGWLDDPTGENQRKVDDARRKLEGETRWAEDQLGEQRKRAAQRAKDKLEQGGQEEEKIADRAGELGKKARSAGALPDQAASSIEDAEQAARQAAEALRRGDADTGLERQREAQRDLEAAREDLRGDEDESSRSDSTGDDGKAGSHDRVPIPKANEHKGPEEFRRRVLEGLGKTSGGGLRDAVQRYAEGLLR
jgi:hypothetical protein